MCGIFCSTFEVDENRLQSWMSYRGRDGFKSYRSPEGVFLYHSLMSVSSEQKHKQPYESEDVVVSFNGEVYNFPELAEILSSHSNKDVLHDETEVVCNFISRFGLKMFAEHAVGMFAIVMFDRQRKTIEFGRDYFGQKPLYYSIANDNIVVGSQYSYFPKDYLTDFDLPTIARMIDFGFPLGDRTPLKGVNSCPRGSIARYCLNENRLSITKYQPKTKDSLGLVARDTFSYVPVVAYSGGIDSVYVADKLANKNGLKLASIGLAESQAEINVKQKSFEQVPQMLWDFSENDFEKALLELSNANIDPVLDPGATVFQHLMACCAGQTRVVFGGDGGDELFYGYGRMKVLYGIQRKLRAVPDMILGKILLFVYLFAVSRRPLAALKSCCVKLQRRAGETWAQTLELDHFFQTVMRKSDSVSLLNEIEYRCPILEEYTPADGDPTVLQYKQKLNLTGKSQKIGFSKIPEGWEGDPKRNVKNNWLKSNPSGAQQWRKRVLDDWISKISK